MNLDWIDWKTNPKEIIDPIKIKENIEQKCKTFKNIMINDVYKNLDVEEKSGVNTDALNINGLTPSNLKNDSILKEIEVINNALEQYLSDIYQEATLQKDKEKNKLISAIDSKIMEEKNTLKENIKLKEEAINSNDLELLNQVNNIIEVTNERIRVLTERLNEARMI